MSEPTEPPCQVAQREVTRSLGSELRRLPDDLRVAMPSCPRLARDTPLEVAPGRFDGVRYDFVKLSKSGWTGEVVWRAVHPVVAGAPVTTHVIIEERAL